MSKKRIAIFGIKYFPAKGGTSRVVENLMWELKDEFDFTIYCYKHEKAENHISGVRTIQFPEIPIKGIGVFIYFAICCCHLLIKGKYDLVHAHKTDSAFFLPLLALKFKLVATSHALPYLNEKWSFFGKIYFKLVERIFVNAKSALTTVSKVQADYYQDNYQKEVKYIPNGIHLPESVNPELATALLIEHQIKPGYLFFAARRVIPLKGCHTLLKALKLIDFKGTIVVAGDMQQLPVYSQQLKKLAEKLDVKFIGYVNGMDKLNALIKQAHFFVFPSEIEAMSMMLLEAGCMGTPMICSDIPPNLAVLSEEEVLYFKSKSAEDLATKLSWAFDNPAPMEELAHIAKAKIEKKYLMKAVAREYAELYQVLLKKSAPIKSLPAL